jgi:hypothetical protein
MNYGQARENLNTLRARVVGAGVPPLNGDDVRGVATPTLLMTGERSPAYPLRLTDRLQQLLPNTERAEIAARPDARGEPWRGQRSDPRLPTPPGLADGRVKGKDGGGGGGPRSMNQPAKPLP